ncbi:MAG: hypothetical protein HN968_12780 [Gammaproteobacteria bacterium]|jgi:hypothetical protein|nr:hypothetical protein [Candidatus Neomarinimicrobiota bacterium]MBT7024583.1 hypothetical protein [Gammaproteobacteria bacterium]
MPFLLLLLFSTIVSAAPQPPELDRTLVSLLAEGEGELWLQGDYVDDSLDVTGYAQASSGIDFSRTLQVGGRYGISELWNLGLNYGLHDDQAWRLGEPVVARSQYNSSELSATRLLYSDGVIDISAHIGWRSHVANELFEDAYSLENKPLNATTTAYARNNSLQINKEDTEKVTIDFTNHSITLDTISNNISLIYQPDGDGFWFPSFTTNDGSVPLLYTGISGAPSHPDYTNVTEISLANEIFTIFPHPLDENKKLPISDPSTPYFYLTHAKAYDRGISGGLTTAFYPTSRLRFSVGTEFRSLQVSPRFSIHPDLINNTEQIIDAAIAMSNFIKSDVTDTSGAKNIDKLFTQSNLTDITTLSNLADQLESGASSARNYLNKLDDQIPQAAPWNEHHLLLSAGLDWWPYDDMGWAAEYTFYNIERSDYQSTEGKIAVNVADQTTNHQLDAWWFIKPAPNITLYLHGRAYSNFLLGDRPLLYNARVNHRFRDPYGYISAGVGWQF